jgi:general secretion pathway protein N
VSRLSLGAVAALAFLLFLLIQAPARLLTRLLPTDQIIMQGLEGSLWDGSASRTLLATSAGYLHLGKVSWTLRPFSLLLFSPSLDIRSEWGDQTMAGRVTVRGSHRIGLRDFEANAPADLVRQFAPVELAGTLSARIQQLLLEDRVPVAAQGSLVWQNAGWRAPQGLMSLGAYAVDFSQSEGEPLVGEIITITGPVQAQGSVRLTTDSYELDLSVGGDAPLDPQLQQALSLLAQPENGSYRLLLEGAL